MTRRNQIDPHKALVNFIGRHTRGEMEPGVRDEIIVAIDYLEQAGEDSAIHRRALELEGEYYGPGYSMTDEAVDWVMDGATQSSKGDQLPMAVDAMMGEYDGNFLNTLDGLVDTFGVESLQEESPGDQVEDLDLEYLNTGDTYASTLVVDGKDIRLSSWGDEREAWERSLYDSARWTRDEEGHWVRPLVPGDWVEVPVMVSAYPAMVSVSDDRGSVPGAHIIVRIGTPINRDVHGTAIPPEGPSPDAWLSDDLLQLLDEAEEFYEMFEFYARLGARGEEEDTGERTTVTMEIPEIADENPKARAELKRRLMR